MLNLLIALVWLVAALADHLGEVLFVPTADYRAGAISKALEIGIVVVAAVWAAVSFVALRSTAEEVGVQ